MATLIGLDFVHVSEVKTDALAGTTYDTLKRIPGAILANVNPNSSNATLFADDGPYDSATTIGEIAIEFNIADLSLGTQAFLLGHTYANGILKRNSSDTPPYVAMGYRTLKSNGKYQYVWNLKGKFGLPEQNNGTKADSIEFNTPTINGSFLRRISDGEWQVVADEEDADFTPELKDAWFTKEFLESLAVPPPVGGG